MNVCSWTFLGDHFQKKVFFTLDCFLHVFPMFFSFLQISLFTPTLSFLLECVFVSFLSCSFNLFLVSGSTYFPFSVGILGFFVEVFVCVFVSVCLCVSLVIFRCPSTGTIMDKPWWRLVASGTRRSVGIFLGFVPLYLSVFFHKKKHNFKFLVIWNFSFLYLSCISINNLKN